MARRLGTRWLHAVLSPFLLATAACEQPRVALCDPDVAGCKILDIYPDAISCNFAALGHNKKDNAADNLTCIEIPADRAAQ